MRNKVIIASGGAVTALVLLLVAFLIIWPRWMTGQAATLIQQSLGRDVSVTGGTYLQLSPLAIRIEGAKFSSPHGMTDSFMTAGTAVIPITFGQFLRGRIQPSSLTLKDAEIALLINERGDASWDVPPAALRQGMSIMLERASLRYFDIRNSQAFTLNHLDGLLETTPDGGANFNGSVVLGKKLVRLNVALKSVVRVNSDGSPLDLALSDENISLSFSGRLLTSKVLSLTGPINLSAVNVTELLNIGDKARALSLDGAIDIAGRAMAFRNMTLTIGDVSASGNLTIDLRAERPRIQSRLVVNELPLDLLLPHTQATPGAWDRSVISTGWLRDLDGMAAIQAQATSFGSLMTGSTQLELKLIDGKLAVTGQAQLTKGGRLTGSLAVDGAGLAPHVSMALQSEETEVQPLLASLYGISHLYGNGGFEVEFSATGSTQEEMIGTLRGAARISLGSGEVRGVDLLALPDTTKQDVSDAPSTASTATPFSSLQGDVTLEDGVATIGNLTISTQTANLSLSGLADLLRHALDIHLKITPAEAERQEKDLTLTGKWDRLTVSTAVSGGALPNAAGDN